MSAKRASKSRPCLGPAQVPARAVGAHDELTLAQGLVGEDRAREPDRPDGARIGAKPLLDLVAGRRPEAAAESGLHLRLLEPVVAAHEREDERAVLRHDRHRLRRRGRVDPEELCKPVDGGRARCLHLDRRVEPLRELGWARNAARDLEVGGVVAVLAA